MSGLWGRKKTRWVYEEPHWVFFLNVLLVVLLRLGAGKLLARGVVWLAGVAHAKFRSWRLGGYAEALAEDAGAAAMGDRDALPGSASREPREVAQQAADGEGSPQAPQQQQHEYRWLGKMVAAAEAPLLICLVVSMACHVVVALLQAVKGAGHASVWVKEAISHIWVVQLLNYTLSTGWLAIRLLDTRLKHSKSRPSLKGDLSNLRDSAPTTSRCYAQEAAVTELIRAAVILVTGLLCLQHVGVNISKLLAVTSLSGVAFSLLLGDILANLFGGFVLYLTQPFAQGDWVQSADGKVDGWIQSLGWYYTTVMRWEKRPHYIPNSTFGFMPIVNCSRMTHRRINFEGSLRMRDLDKVEEILTDIRNLIQNHNDIDKDMHRLCGVKEFNDVAVIIWISCYIKNITLAKYLQVQESVLLGICGILRKYETNWASELERFQAVQGAQGDAELTNEFRRLLNAKSALVNHERDLEEREAKLQKVEVDMEQWQGRIKEFGNELRPKLASLMQHEELVRTRQDSMDKRSDAVCAKSMALNMREKALEKLQTGIELFRRSPEDAMLLHQEALHLRERSIEMAWKAVEIERGAIESERDALEQEREILERKRTTEELIAAIPTTVAPARARAPPEDEVTAPEKRPPKPPPAPPSVQGTAPTGGEAAATAVGALPVPVPTISVGEGAAASEEVDEHEQAALAIGGE